MTDDSSTLPRRQLGRKLREAREEANMVIAFAAAQIEIGATTLQGLETGRAKRVRIRDVQALCDLYDVAPDITTAMTELAKQAAVKNWWQDFGDLMTESLNLYVGMEASAREMIVYRPYLVPGLLQTADYARTLDRLNFPHDPEPELERRIEIRMKRQALITRKSSPAHLRVVLHESVIRTSVGGPKVMAAQLRKLADAPENVDVRVLPFEAGYAQGIAPGPFVIMDFGQDSKGRPIEPPIVYLEGILNANVYLEKPADVSRYHRAYEGIQHSALDTRTSKGLLRQAAREYLG